MWAVAIARDARGELKDERAIGKADALELFFEGARERVQLWIAAAQSGRFDPAEAQLGERGGERARQARTASDGLIAAEALLCRQNVEDARRERLRGEATDRCQALLRQGRQGQLGGEARQRGAMPAERGTALRSGAADELGRGRKGRRENENLFAARPVREPLAGALHPRQRRNRAHQPDGHAPYPSPSDPCAESESDSRSARLSTLYIELTGSSSSSVSPSGLL